MDGSSQEEEDSTFTNISLADDVEEIPKLRGEFDVPEFVSNEMLTFCRATSCGWGQEHSSRIWHPRPRSLLSKMMNADMDAVDAENQVELEEKTRLINQVLELQHTLEDLSARVDAVKEENLKLKSENQVLGQYIENLMSASSVFQTTDTKSKRK
ncbi:short coiled-coil protein isoform X1 [Oryctolagus cuniculus]|uniref:short coiled-coil protein isoform X1 n=1 Tax=Oryctolagus cuniculus TaxID=9986 RepID=UPI0007EE7AD2